jgi:hypothetical protein
MSFDAWHVSMGLLCGMDRGITINFFAGNCTACYSRGKSGLAEFPYFSSMLVSSTRPESNICWVRWLMR